MDNNILIDLAETNNKLSDNSFKILNKLFNDVYIPSPILTDEVQVDLKNLEYKTGIIEKEKGFNFFFFFNDSDNERVFSGLSDYDKHFLSISFGKNILAASNDGLVRKLAKRYDIEITGILGIMAATYETDIINFRKLKSYYKFLFSDDSSFYVSHHIKDEICQFYNIEL